MIRLSVEDYVAVVAMNRAPVNALNPSYRQELIETFDILSDREDVRVVILTSDLDVFSAGADLKHRTQGTPGEWGNRNRLARETKNAIRDCSKPVIAAVNGAALGAGFGLAGACDVLVASTDAVFGMPEIDVGLAGGASLLGQYFGRSRMRRMMFTGMRMPAQELHRLGVLDECVPPEKLMPTAMEIASEIAAKSPTAIGYAKTSLNLVELMSPAEAYRFEQGFTVELSKSDDVAEIRAALQEGRPPVFGAGPEAKDGPAKKSSPVGVIGLGNMGSGIAASLARTGRQVIGFDVDPARRVTTSSGRRVGSIRELAEACDEVMLVLPDGDAVRDAAESVITHAGPGTLMVDCSTVEPVLSRQLATAAEASGLEFADAGMGGGVSNAAQASLLFMVGCKSDVWPRVEDFLRPIGRDVVHCGEAGAGVTLKAITNLLWLTNYVADVEALVFARAAGIAPSVATRVWATTGASNRALAMASDQLLAGDIRNGFPISLAHKDLRVAVEEARRLGLDLSSLEPTLSVFETALQEDMGGDGVAGAGEAVARRLGVDLTGS